MLKKLSVRNFVLIDELEISFDEGLSIITGETGAGKSILLGALNLILGQRADSRSLLSETGKCVVEAVFDISQYDHREFFTQNDLDFENLTTVRREITPEGKSRAFINDTPVTLNVLKAFTSLLVDIHSQHETLLLNQPGFQLNVVDAYAGNKELLQEYGKLIKEYRSTERSLAEAIEKENKGRSEADYLRFQLNEFRDAKLVSGEAVLLEEEQERLMHAEEISVKNNELLNFLSEGEENVISQISVVRQGLSVLSRFGSPYKELLERLQQVLIELKDISSELSVAGESSSADPHRLAVIQERLALIYHLQQKHRIDSVEKLIEFAEDTEAKLQNLSSLEESIEQFRNALSKLKNDLMLIADKLSAGRKSAAPLIESEIVKILGDLAMPHARLKIEFAQAEEGEFYNEGRDRVRFMFAANKGKNFTELQKSASGGELSRFMLAVKSLQARLTQMPTVIFDEIDTGISGETAAKTGMILRNMASHHQVFSITHLPQIAARGTTHYFVYKETGRKDTRTRIRRLNEEERIRELARMLSGEQLTDAALSNARELLAAG